MCKIFVILFFLISVPFVSSADSPLTSTVFYEVYADIEAVDEANLYGDITKVVFNFLESEATLDKKMAVINALGYANTLALDSYESMLIDAHQLDSNVFDRLRTVHYDEAPNLESTKEFKLTGDQFFCWAYLQALAEYTEPKQAYNALYLSNILKPDNEATYYVIGLVGAQIMMSDFSKWCDMFLFMKRIHSGTYTEGILRAEAKQIIFNYINLYAEDCSEEENQPVIIEKEKGIAWIEDGSVKVVADSFKIQPASDKVNLMIESSSITLIYDRDIKGSLVGFKIKNKGKKPSNKCIVVLEDNAEEYEESVYDYIPIGVLVVPVIKPNEEIKLTFSIFNHWLYNPNCDIKIRVDYLNHIKEKNEKDNVGELLENG